MDEPIFFLCRVNCCIFVLGNGYRISTSKGSLVDYRMRKHLLVRPLYILCSQYMSELQLLYVILQMLILLSFLLLVLTYCIARTMKSLIIYTPVGSSKESSCCSGCGLSGSILCQLFPRVLEVSCTKW